MPRHEFIALPDVETYTLRNVRVPACCIQRPSTESSQSIKGCVDGLVAVDVVVSGDRIAAIQPAHGAAVGEASLDLRESMLLPAFVDMHTHIGGSPYCMASLPPCRDLVQ